MHWQAVAAPARHPWYSSPMESCIFCRFVADGEAAGQEVFHLHLHLIPRNPGDGFGLHFPPDYRQLPERKALDWAAHTISGALADTPPATSD